MSDLAFSVRERPDNVVSITCPQNPFASRIMSEFLSLDVEYLGFLNGELRNLKGFSTLAHELIQNADDANGATEITFDVRDDALVVANDGRFSDCGDMNTPECAWRESHDHRCDFHRFRRTASGDKRRQADTTGAFGIGFISVYQITDRPELASGTRHWTIRPDEPAHQRVRVHPVEAEETGTRFRLPWAREADTVMRRDLALAPVTDEDVIALVRGIYDALPSAVLFLKKLDRLRLLRNGDPMRTVERVIEGDRVAVSVNDASVQEWILVRGSFENEAAALRVEAGQQIEKERSANVTVAIPVDGGDLEGRFHACLPTQHPTGLPIHLDADFYPNTDRKRIVFENDYQGQWNRAAVRAAARAVAAALPTLRDRLGAERLWALLQAMADLYALAGKGDVDQSLGAFSTEARAAIAHAKIVPTGKGWFKPADATLLQNRDEETPNIPVLEALGFAIASPSLAPHTSLLRAVGVTVVDGRKLAAALNKVGLAGRVSPTSAPAWLTDKALHGQLADEIATLRKRTEAADDDLASCAIAIAADGAFAPPNALLRSAGSAAKPLTALGGESLLLADTTPKAIAELVPSTTARRMLAPLQSVSAESFEALWSEAPETHLALLRWVLDKEVDLKADATTREGYATLSIWPSASGLHPLSDLAVPGGFEDPLGLSDLVDARLLSERNRIVLTDTFEVRKLTIQTYATDFVPAAYQKGAIDEDGSRHLEDLFAKHLGELREDVRVRQALTACPMVPCRNGVRCTADEAYFLTPLVRAVLDAPPIAAVTDRNRPLLEWLGVQGTPRVDHVLDRVRTLAAEGPPIGDRRQAAGALLEAIGTAWTGHFPAALKKLSQIAWLPARGDIARWYQPSDLYAVYNETVFASQAAFLDVSARIQARARKLIDALGVEITPKTPQICDHLLHLAGAGERANERIYQFLSQRIKDQGSATVIQRKLKGQACLHDDGRFYRPDHAFWQSHPFGQHRVRLDSAWGAHADLLELLGVRDKPMPSDAIAVLRELADAYGPTNSALTDDDLLVARACWRMLGASFQSEEIESDPLAALSSAKVVVNDQHLLVQTERMFFDDVPGMADRFAPVLDHNLVARQSGVWPALEAAGVRSLRDVVTARPVEADASEHAEDVQERLKERRPLLNRAMEWKRPGAASLLDDLDGLRAEVTRQLHVQYHLDAFGQSYTSDPEETSALLDTDRGVLLVSAPDGRIAWGAVAREIASAIANGEDQAHVAMALKEVLAPDTDAGAVTNLDDLGCPPLEGADEEEIAPEAILGSQADAEESDTHGETATDPEPTSPASSTGTAPTPQPTPNGSTQQSTPTSSPTSGTSDSGGGNGSGSPSGKPAPDTRTPGTPPNGSTSNGRRRSPASGGKPNRDAKPSGIQSYRYVTYVGHQQADGEPEATERRSDNAQARSDLGDLGEKAVCRFEKAQGRIPIQMPPMNPGYDIESVDGEGHTRYIEVKTLPGEWGQRGVVLSDTQFACALKKGEAYWLYVVRNAGSPSTQIICIQDPACMVSDYAFDEGWQTVGRTHSIVLH